MAGGGCCSTARRPSAPETRAGSCRTRRPRGCNELSSRAENVDSLFSGFGVPRTFDLLSIDIDGNDYWVWKALERHRPRVVLVEYNIFFGVHDRRTIPYDARHEWDKSGYHGATLAAFRDLGEQKGYALVYTDPYAPNAFFVSRDELGAGWSELSLEEVDRWGELGDPPDPANRSWVTP